MTEFVTAGGRDYPLRRKTGGGPESSGETKHVRLTVGTNCRTGAQIQHDYTGKDAEEVQAKIDASRAWETIRRIICDKRKNLNPQINTMT